MEASGDNLQGNDSYLSFPGFNVRNMPPIHVEVNGEVCLRPTFLQSEISDSVSKLDAKGMVAPGHADMQT